MRHAYDDRLEYLPEKYALVCTGADGSSPEVDSVVVHSPVESASSDPMKKAGTPWRRPALRNAAYQAAMVAWSWLAALRVAAFSCRAALSSASAFFASPMATPSARTKRTSVMPKKPNTVCR